MVRYCITCNFLIQIALLGMYASPQNSQPVQLHTAVYWACVTIATIGYGDYAPTTAIGQLIFPVIILIIILVLPQKISNLSEVMQVRNRHANQLGAT